MCKFEVYTADIIIIMLIQKKTTDDNDMTRHIKTHAMWSQSATVRAKERKIERERETRTAVTAT